MAVVFSFLNRKYNRRFQVALHTVESGIFRSGIGYHQRVGRGRELRRGRDESQSGLKHIGIGIGCYPIGKTGHSEGLLGGGLPIAVIEAD